LPSRARSSLITLLALYLTFLGGTSFTNVLLWPRVAHHAILALLLGGWLLSLIVRRRPFPATPLDLPILIYLAVYLLSALLAVDPRISLEQFWLMGTHALLFYLLVDTMRAYGPVSVLKPLMFTLAVFVLVGLSRFVQWYFGLPPFALGWAEIGGLQQPIPPVILREPIGPHSITGASALLAMWVPVGLAWAATTPHPETRRMWLMWLAGVFAMTLLTFSRGGILSLAVSLPALAFLALAGVSRWGGRIQAWLSHWRNRATLIALALLAATAIALGVVRLGNLRASLTGTPSEPGDAVRLDLWRSAVEIGLQHPLLGAGIYSFGREMRTLRDPLRTGEYLNVPHSYPLLVWAEAGLLGVLAMLFLTGRAAWMGFQRWRAASGPERLRVSGMCAGLLGFAAHNFVDHLVITPYLLSAFALAGYLAPPEETSQASQPIHRALPGALLAALTVSLIPQVLSHQAYFFATQANAAEAADDLDTALGSIAVARQIDPALGLYSAQHARYLGALALEGQAPLEAAIAAYQEAYRSDDTFDVMHASEAVLLQHAGRSSEALTAMQRALALFPADHRYALWAGQYAELAGESGQARQHYRSALESVPYWSVSAFWEQTPLRESIRGAFLAEQGLSSVPRCILRAIPDACWPLLIGQEPSPGLWTLPSCQALLALRLDNQPDRALDWIEQAQPGSHGPTLSTLYVLRAEAYLALGDLAQAERDAQIALFLGDRLGYLILGRLAEARNDPAEAADAYRHALPVLETRRAWSFAVYSRKDAFPLPAELSAPSYGPDDWAAALELVRLYQSQGDAEAVTGIIHAMRLYDPFFDPTALPEPAYEP